jgi:fibronectin type 3 domain-containing protein
MKFLPIPCNLQTHQWIVLGAASLLTVAAAGCASPGPPRAPSLNLPEVVKNLTAERVGDQVRLSWETSSKTTDHIDIKGLVTAQICRAPVSSPNSAQNSPPATTTSGKAPTCNVVKSLPVQSGPTEATEILPQTLSAGPPVLLAYRVQLLNANGRSAGPSKEAFAVAGAAPPPVEQLHATAVREGVLLEWQKRDTTAEVELDRRLEGPAGATVGAAPAKVAAPTKTTSRSRKPLTPTPAPSSKPQALPMTPSTPAEVKLQTPKQAADAGGTVDQTTKIGESYSYTAQRVSSVLLDGHTLLLRSTVSAPVTFISRDVFPPLVPTDLEAVPGGATPADRSIDLSWTPNTDSDLTGYSVYRQEVTSTGEVAGTAARLNSTPVVGPAYRDQTAVPGHRYSYRVTAVDSAGNESAPSAAVQETLREQ